MNLSGLSPLLRFPLVSRITTDALLRFDPELAHDATIRALILEAVPAPVQADPPELRTTLAGINLANPVGMAAGFNKYAEPINLSRIGFGLEEVGTITPRPQQGNDKPRIFRLESAGAIVNRAGFNNLGHEDALRKLRCRTDTRGLGVNIGANKDSPDFVADYVLGVQRFAEIADYLTVNVSSPNTPGLRNLQAREALKRLLGEVLAARATQKKRVPVFLKLAPDLDETQMDEIAIVIGATDLDGLIVSNTTLSRAGVENLPHASEAGGLSGRPLFNLATQRLAQMRQRVGGAMPIIGVGGIHSAESAVAKFAAGANAIQLYSALVYGGLPLLYEIKRGLVEAVRAAGAEGVSALTGTAVDDWASGRLTL